MSDRTDLLIEALVRAREAGMSRDECAALVKDTFDAPWRDRRLLHIANLFDRAFKDNTDNFVPVQDMVLHVAGGGAGNTCENCHAPELIAELLNFAADLSLARETDAACKADFEEAA